jgi:hypothetical protein
MANTLLTVDEITAEALRVLHNNLKFVAAIDKQHDKQSEIAGQKRGGSIRIRKPIQPTVRTTWALNAQDVTEEYETLTVGTVRGVDLNFTEAEMSQDITSFSRQFITPSVKRLASEIDKLTFAGCVNDVYNLVGTAGTTPNAASYYLSAGARMNHFATPEEDRVVIINPDAQASTVGGLSSLFHAASAIEAQYKKGRMGKDALGFNDWYMSQNVPTITCGTRTGTILIDGTVATEGSTTIHIDGLGSAGLTVKEGEVFTVADCYAVNPETKATLPFLQQFVVQADVTATGTTECDVTVLPKIYTSASGGLQTVDSFPTDGKTVTFTGTASTAYPHNLAFHPEFATFATANLEMPADVSFKSQMSVDGINIRILRQYDINNSMHPCRMDVFFGYLVQRPSMACRIIG